MKIIIRVTDDEELLVECPLCWKQTVLYHEDDNICKQCWNEINETNIAAWTEYFESQLVKEYG